MECIGVCHIGDIQLNLLKDIVGRRFHTISTNHRSRMVFIWQKG